MVLDLFVEELNRIPPSAPHLFRSRVLNPILQRQLRGVSDHEPKAIRKEIKFGKDARVSIADAASFYLAKDPLDQSLSRTMLRNLLYVWSVRLSLGYLLPKSGKCTEVAFEWALANTETLNKARGPIDDDVWDEETVSSHELTLIEGEKLEDYYDKLTSEVSNTVVSPLPTVPLIAQR